VIGWVKDGCIIANKSLIKNNSLLECCSNLVWQSAMHNEIDLLKMAVTYLYLYLYFVPEVEKERKGLE